MNKLLISILILGAASLLAVSSFAAGSLLTIEVDPSIKILVNGEEFKPKDVNGNDVMTFTYNGTTYAPLRALAEAYGLEVGYDAEKKMATVSEPGSAPDTVNNNPSPSSSQSSAVTLGMTNALKKADEYLNVMAFSYEGLIEQLEYSKFSHEEAVYAADNCGADWNEQAVKKANEYLDVMAFSRDSLVDQLKYSGFTEDQAIYAVDQIGY